MSSPASPLIRGTSLSVRFSRPVDGDTIRVFLPGAAKDESVRILSVDTEESFSTSATKPVTPWGKAAKHFCYDFFRGVSTVTIEFPGFSPLDEALRRHRGTFGRLLVHVWREADGVDFSEALIARGYSPYYNKYGHAHFAGHRARYEGAERRAQREGVGIWDLTGVVNDGKRFNNYALLKAWWNVRAEAIEEFRKVKRVGDTSVLDAENDYDRIVQLASKVDDTTGSLKQNVVTVFTDVPDIRVHDTYASLSIGARYKPLSVYIPRVSATASLADAADANGEEGGVAMDAEEEVTKGQQVVNVLLNRYVDEGPMYPRRGFVFLSGLLRMFRGRPQLVVDDPVYVRDSPGPRPKPPASSLPASGGLLVPKGEEAEEEEDDVPPPVRRADISVRIAALLPDPAGGDSGNELVTLGVTVDEQPMGENENGMTEEDGKGDVSLKGWKLRDLQGRTNSLNDVVVTREKMTTPETLVDVKIRGLTLNNGGDTVFVLDDEGRVVDRVEYSATDVKTGLRIEFPRE